MGHIFTTKNVKIYRSHAPKRDMSRESSLTARTGIPMTVSDHK